MRRISVISALLLCAFLLPQQAIVADTLEEGFASPPASAKPSTWWHWMNGNITKEGITADLEAMQRVGVGEAQIFNVDCEIPAGPVKVMSPEWREMIKHAAIEADRLGIKLCIHNCPGWSSSGGPWNTPEHAMQLVVTTEIQAKGPEHFSAVLPQPETHLGFYRDIAVLAFKTPANGGMQIDNLKGKAGYDRQLLTVGDNPAVPADQVVDRGGIIDLTARLQSDGRLEWDAPEGEWTILRIGHTPSGKTNHPAPEEGTGPECDKMSREAAQAHWDGMMKPVLDDIGPLAGTSVDNVLIDSYEVGPQNWTPAFREEFQKRRGYDLFTFMPTFAGHVVESPEATERFLWDLRRTIADLYADNYYGFFTELAHEKGLKMSIEPYDGPFESIQCGAPADVVMGEFWTGTNGHVSVKLAASIAHVYGQNLVGAESFTAGPSEGRWQNDPYSFKRLGDLMWCTGLNRYIFHRYAMQPWLDRYPGMTMGQWGFHFDRTNTWWNQGRAWLQYIARSQFMLQSGRFAADALYYYGEDAPYTFLEDLKPALPKGYDYDECNADVILHHMSVKDGRIILDGGMQYAVLILPENKTMTPPVLKKIKSLVESGATVIGPKPEKSPSLQDWPKCDEDIKADASALWGACDGDTVKENEVDKGKIVWGKPLEEVFATMELKPDFEYANDQNDTKLAYIHRIADGADIYFVSNQKMQSDDVDCTFRVSGKAPELWHADTGVMEKAPVYAEQDGRITVPLHFDPAGSAFVVFRKKTNGEDHIIHAAHTTTEAAQTPANKLEITRAVYEAIDGAGSADVTSIIAGHVRDGALVAKVGKGVPAEC